MKRFFVLGFLAILVAAGMSGCVTEQIKEGDLIEIGRPLVTTNKTVILPVRVIGRGETKYLELNFNSREDDEDEDYFPVFMVTNANVAAAPSSQSSQLPNWIKIRKPLITTWATLKK